MNFAYAHNMDFIAQTCTEAGKDPGCCVGSFPSCYVAGARCYCDEVCTTYGDCCSDVSVSTCRKFIQNETNIQNSMNLFFNKHSIDCCSGFERQNTICI